MTSPAHTRALGALLAVGLLAAGCGDADEGEQILGPKARQMEQQLDAVQAAVDEKRCDDVPGAVSNLQATIRTLEGDGVGDDVIDALSDGADNLRSVARDDCQPEEEPVETTPETVPTTPPPTETTPPPTETTPPPTETEPPPPETEPPPDETEPPPDEGDGGGQFDPGGGGVGPDGSGPPGQNGKDG